MVSPLLFNISGIEVNIWRNQDENRELAHLPVAILILLHGRLERKQDVDMIMKRMLEIQRSKPSGWGRELIVATFDHRNHGGRIVNPIANNAWDQHKPEKHNPNHALDMYTIQVGTATDVSTLIDFLPSYLYPCGERVIEQWILAGVSLGGHSTWIGLTKDPRITVGIPIIGCPDFLHLMVSRASGKGIPIEPPYFPAHFVAYIHKNDPAYAPIDRNDTTNPFLNKKVLAIVGGKDKLVSWEHGVEFFNKLNVGELGFKEVFVDDEAGHCWTDAMGNKMAQFIERYTLYTT